MHGSETPPTRHRESPVDATWIRRAFRRVRKGLRAAGEIYEGIYFAPYRSQIYRSYREERDTFLLLGFADLLGAPNPDGVLRPRDLSRRDRGIPPVARAHRHAPCSRRRIQMLLRATSI